MATLPANVSAAFDELTSGLSGGGASVSSALSAKLESVNYSPAIADKLRESAARFSPDFLGDFLGTVKNQAPAAANPPAVAASFKASAISPWLLAAGAGLLLWGFSRGR